MLYQHLTESCFDPPIRDAGLREAEYNDVLAACEPAIEGLRRAHEVGRLSLLKLPKARGDIETLKPIAKNYRESFRDVVLLGTGGASLGGQTLCALAGQGPKRIEGTPRLWFMDKVDPDTFDAMMKAINLRETGFLVVSKSGSTAETVLQFLVTLGQVRAVLGAAAIPRHFTMITEPGGSPMRELARRFQIPVLDHDPKLGGRYSVLSLTGLLPAMIAGLDPFAVREGAATVLDALLTAKAAKDFPPAVGAAINVGLARHRFVTATVLMLYVDRLADFGSWFRQLWAESLGKGGNGTTPIRAMGPVDQHSQLQLYLGGPADKLFTIVQRDVAKKGHQVDPSFTDDPALYYLSGRTMGDLVEAEQRATVETLARNGRPVRVIRIATLDERVMGALLMHFMIETIISANLFGVDPFDQPSVEEGKVLTRDYLRQTGIQT
ncbi:MAG: glucose-6-phosphate isomerase [Alphaproteobacteria bacterium]